eukprot:CAMPEP_0113578920 /NCGR_PEP_ID=MMETSP0015_2-20120614/29775_1 /TAXON_ID=2838 /ORGANISM="Odontella" /LENGTH=64 /DNA_ID=CAMNT_0000482831 /DNA_START=503 /DNA_END=694 /DNA_ORIENTATION=- /assembly_acc=CAM_ASM_000160
MISVTFIAAIDTVRDRGNGSAAAAPDLQRPVDFLPWLALRSAAAAAASISSAIRDVSSLASHFR